MLAASQAVNPNLEVAKTACEDVLQKFISLNKPIQAEMVFKPEGVDSPEFQLLHKFSNIITIGISPFNISWKDTFPPGVILIFQIKAQMGHKFQFDCQSIA